MRSSFYFVAPTVIALGCNKITGPTNDKSPVLVTFTLSDTTGKSATEFRYGEDFEMSVSVTNISPDTVTYHSGMPALRFLVMMDSNVAAGSVLGCVLPGVVRRSHLDPGKTLESVWIGPASVCESQKVNLPPGSYEARVVLPAFDSISVEPVTPIAFMVVR